MLSPLEQSSPVSETEKDSMIDTKTPTSDPGDIERTISFESKNKTLTEPTKEDEESKPAPPYTRFSKKHKILIIAIVTAAAFLGPTSGAIYLPALPVFERVFDASTTTINATVSVFMVFFAIAPLVWAAFADYGGRKTIYLISLAIFIAANIFLAALPAHLASLFIFRVFQAIGSCGVTAVGAGSVADVIEPAKRASALSIFLLGPQVGPVLGPLIGGQFANVSSWRWMFGFLAIFSSVIYLLILFLLPETLRCLVGNGELYASKPWIVKPRLWQRPLVDQSLFPRPPKLKPKMLWRLIKHPAILIVSLNGTILFASYYAMVITFAQVFRDNYGFSGKEVGYALLVPGISLIVGSLLGGKTSDLVRAKAIKKSDTNTVPAEFRIRQQIPGFILSAGGILMYGWFVDFVFHPALILFGSALAGFGMTWVFVSSTTYQTECFPTYAATLVALAGLLRNPAAAVAAVIIDPLVDAMGFGWCYTGLAFLNLAGILGVLFIQRRDFDNTL